MAETCCCCCSKVNLSRNEVGITKKLLGEKSTQFYCLSCLANYLGASEQDILDKIQEFKENGCKLFV